MNIDKLHELETIPIFDSISHNGFEKRYNDKIIK